MVFIAIALKLLIQHVDFMRESTIGHDHMKLRMIKDYQWYQHGNYR